MKNKNPRRIKFYQFSVFLILSFYCIPQLHATINNRSIVCGEITNFDDPYDLPPLEMISYHPFIIEGQKSPQYIERDGKFKFVVNNHFACEVYFAFGSHNFSVYTNPGDSIYLIIDVTLLTDSLVVSDIGNLITISSPNQTL